MIVAIVCPGPSVPKLRPQCDLLIGVNRAATLHDCDVFAALDWPTVERIGSCVKGSPTLFSLRDSIQSLSRCGRAWPHQTIEVEDVEWPKPPQWPLYSLTAAAAYAASCGATCVSVYGADWAGELDWDGTPAGDNRSTHRWERERQIFQSLSDTMHARGIEMFRITQ